MMRTALSELSYFQPKSMTEATTMFSNEVDLTPLAGGTDLYVTLNAGLERSRRFIDLSRIAALRRIHTRGSWLVIGATATYSDLIRHREVQRRVPILIEAARLVGGVQIQNRGTIGGNVGNASPAGDTLPVLAVVEARIVLESARGRRSVAFAEYFTGYKRSVRGGDEIIRAIEIPRVSSRQWFRKVGARAAQAISKVVAAGIVEEDGPRFALGAVAPTVVRARGAEAALRASEPVEVVAQALRDEIAPIDDVRSTREYRTQVATHLLAQFARSLG